MVNGVSFQTMVNPCEHNPTKMSHLSPTEILLLGQSFSKPRNNSAFASFEK